MQPCVTVSRGGKASTPHREIVGCLGASAARPHLAWRPDTRAHRLRARARAPQKERLSQCAACGEASGVAV